MSARTASGEARLLTTHDDTPRVAARRGFGLPELLFALVLLAVGLLGMASLMVSTTRLDRLSGSRETVTVLAEATMEQLRAYARTPANDPLRARLAIGGSLTTAITNYSDSATGPNGRKYVRRWQITAGVAGTRRATVRVETVNRNNQYEVRFLDFTTLIDVP